MASAEAPRAHLHRMPPITFKSLYSKPVINPLNLKANTFPILRLDNPYSRTFWLSSWGFFVAFLSWFAFPPLNAVIRTSEGFTADTIANGNIIGLTATLVVRVIVGPFVDRYGPKKVMAAILLVGSIPSGLAGTINSPGSFYAIRFFVGLLGGTFVPCQAWTTCFYDKNIVGRVNAMAGGLGNAGGGATFIFATLIYDGLINRIASRVAWRVYFVIFPVPLLLLTAAAILIFGDDHPAGKWSNRHNIPANALSAGDIVQMSEADAVSKESDRDAPSTKQGKTSSYTSADSDPEKERHAIQPVDEQQEANNATALQPKTMARIKVTTNEGEEIQEIIELDKAVNEPMTWKSAGKMLTTGVTFLTPLMYFTSFGAELALDSYLPNIITGLHPDWAGSRAGYLASLYGLLNIFTRFTGGYLADRLYRRYGVKSKQWFTAFLGAAQGIILIGWGFAVPNGVSIGGLVVIFVIFGFINEGGNGSNFALVPHINPHHNGMQSALTGASGNLGGICFALIFRFVTQQNYARAIYATGFISLGLSAICAALPLKGH